MEASVPTESGLGGRIAIGFKSEFAVLASKAGRVDPLKLHNYNDIIKVMFPNLNSGSISDFEVLNI